jgi:hypothetical protein
MLTIVDCAQTLACAGEAIPLIGGQAVAWWALRYQKQLPAEFATPVASRDIDFWADREQLDHYAKLFGAKPQYPNQYEMTVLAGVIPVEIAGQRTSIEFLHTVPGLDVNDPDAATVLQEMDGIRFRVLDPVSLTCTKLHALRNFEQAHRQDLYHLRVCLSVCRPFIDEALRRSVQTGLWYCERLIRNSLRQNNQKVMTRHQLEWKLSIPLSTVELLLASEAMPSRERERLRNFLEKRWSRLK